MLSRSRRSANVKFREYALVLSDNPTTTSGPPIGIGWNYYPKDASFVDLDEYESGRGGNRRSERELSLPPDLRDIIMLREIGYSRKEILEAIRIANKDKIWRRVSIQRQRKCENGHQLVDFLNKRFPVILSTQSTN